MSRLNFTRPLVIVATLVMMLASPFSIARAEAVLGKHIVQPGDTLYCLGRAYGVLPSAIAEANGLGPLAKLSLEQVLIIPAVQWVNIPAGPVCVVQFASPYSGQSPTLSTPIPTSTPTPSGTVYLVKRGDTLWRISRAFGVTVDAIKSANGLPSNSDLILVGQVLAIPGITGCPYGCIAQRPECTIKGNISFDTKEKIYHVPGGQFYDETIINPDFGERWFCTEAEAIANGWRKSQR